MQFPVQSLGAYFQRIFVAWKDVKSPDVWPLWVRESDAVVLGSKAIFKGLLWLVSWLIVPFPLDASLMTMWPVFTEMAIVELVVAWQ